MSCMLTMAGCSVYRRNEGSSSSLDVGDSTITEWYTHSTAYSRAMLAMLKTQHIFHLRSIEVGSVGRL